MPPFRGPEESGQFGAIHALDLDAMIIKELPKFNRILISGIGKLKK